MKKGLFALTLEAVLLFVVSCSGGGTDNLSFGSAHYDLASTRNVPVTDITKDNIKDLGVVWKADFKALDANIPNGNQNFPIVVDGVLYTTTGQNHIFAFDAATGAQKWHWTPDAELVATATKLHGGANRGVAVDGGFVYIVLYDNRVTKIDAKTGSTVTEAKIAELLPEQPPPSNAAGRDGCAPPHALSRRLTGPARSSTRIRLVYLPGVAHDATRTTRHPPPRAARPPPLSPQKPVDTMAAATRPRRPHARRGRSPAACPAP